MKDHILLVEDEAAISEPLEFLLEREGYAVTTVADGARVLETFDTTNPDLVLLDLMLPNVPGTEICRQLRTRSTVPIIMLTAKDSEVDIVVGLELGADDYITKPYSTREVIARIRAVLRRRANTATDTETVLSVGHVRLDVNRHVATIGDVETPIPLKEFELLEMLMRNAGNVLTRAQLIDRVWGADYFGDTKTLDVHVKRLRSRLEPNPSKPRFLVTVRGVGYRLDHG